MDIGKTRNFVMRNARPLDAARWRFLFEGGSVDAVLDALSAYQNEDGGFGHGLEPDCLNPDSSPVQTWAATEIIKETGLTDSEHPIMKGILKYLSSGADFDGRFWASTVKSNDDYPHAPWWSYRPETGNYNPTASLAGFCLRFGNPSSPMFHTAQSIALDAYEWFRTNCPIESMHTVYNFLELSEYLYESECSIIDHHEFEDLIERQLSSLLTADSEKWESEYVARPSLYITSSDSPYYSDQKKACDAECDFLERTQLPDGTWAITWAWDSYPEEWSVSKNFWKADQAIRNVKFLKGMGYLNKK
ncbi:MAG: hypothetical protein ACI4NM_00995 [Bullifex sp.]